MEQDADASWLRRPQRDKKRKATVSGLKAAGSARSNKRRKPNWAADSDDEEEEEDEHDDDDEADDVEASAAAPVAVRKKSSAATTLAAPSRLADRKIGVDQFDAERKFVTSAEWYMSELANGPTKPNVQRHLDDMIKHLDKGVKDAAAVGNKRAEQWFKELAATVRAKGGDVLGVDPKRVPKMPPEYYSDNPLLQSPISGSTGADASSGGGAAVAPSAAVTASTGTAGGSSAKPRAAATQAASRLVNLRASGSPSL